MPLEIEKRLKKLARKTGRTNPFYVGEDILQRLDNLEDCDLAVQRLEEDLPSVPSKYPERLLGSRD